MKPPNLVLCTTLAFGSTFAGAQSEVGGNASAQSETVIAAHHCTASAASEDSAAANLETQQRAADSESHSEFGAMLSKSIDARTSKPGEEVTATATQDLKSKHQLIVPRGSKLIGHVTLARLNLKGSADTATSATAVLLAVQTRCSVGSTKRF